MVEPCISTVYNDRIMFNEACPVVFTGNMAMQHGGAVYVHDSSSVQLF